MKLSELLAKRKELYAERDALLALTDYTPEQEVRADTLANELAETEAGVRAAQIRERFASQGNVQKMLRNADEQQTEQRSSDKYRQEWGAYLRGGKAPELRDNENLPLEMRAALLTTANSGILIPKVYEDQILKYVDANSVIRQLADTKTGIQGYATLRYNTMESASFGSAFWTAEANPATETEVTGDYAEVALEALQGYPTSEVSWKLIKQANYDVEAEVVDNLQRAISKGTEAGYMGGTGASNIPTGIFVVNTSNNVTAATSSGTTRALAVTAGITVAKLLEMRYSKLPASNWMGSSWLFPQDSFAALCALPSGITNDVRPIFTPTADSNPIGNGPSGTLLGRPVYVTEYLPTHSSTGSTGKNCIALFGRISDAFAIREWGGISVMRDEITKAGMVRYKGMVFGNSKQTRVKALVGLHVTNA